MNDVGVLVRLKRVELRNRVAQLLAVARFKSLVILAFSVAFWFSLYRLFLHGMRFIKAVGAQGYFDELMSTMFHVFFFALMLMLVFSNAIISYTSFFKSRETSFLLSAPVRPESVFLYKLAESVAFSSWAFLFLGTPLMAAYGQMHEVTWHFYVLSILFFAAFLFLPAAVGAILAMLVTVYAPRTGKGIVAATVVTVLILAAIYGGRLLAMQPGFNADMKVAMEIFESVGFSRHPLLPSTWMAKGIIQLRSGDTGGAFFFLGLIATNGLFLMVVAHALSARLLPVGWFISQGLRSSRRFGARGVIDWTLDAGLWILRPAVRRIVIKDVKSFVRDPVQWSQFLIFFGLLAIYFLNLRTFGYEDRNPFWKNLIAQMNLLATSLTLATFSSRFIFPQLSLEGRRFWILGMAPMERDQILFGKLALCFASSLAISETLILVSSLMLRTPLALGVLHAVALFGICLGLSGLSVGLGAVYPDFAEDNPSKIVSGFGGTLNLVVSLTFVVAVLAIQAVPCFLYFGQAAIPPSEFRLWIIGSMAAIAAVSLAACLIPMGMGLRTLRRLEI